MSTSTAATGRTPPTDSVPAMPSAPTRASVVRNSLGVSVATGAYGVSFGAVGVAAGLGVRR